MPFCIKMTSLNIPKQYIGPGIVEIRNSRGIVKYYPRYGDTKEELERETAHSNFDVLYTIENVDESIMNAVCEQAKMLEEARLPEPVHRDAFEEGLLIRLNSKVGA